MIKANNKRFMSNGEWITPLERLARYLRDGFICGYCGTDLHGADPRSVTLDHLKCRRDFHGNTSIKTVHAPENTITACKSCNSKRGCKPWRKYAPGGAIKRIENLRRRRMTRYRRLARAILSGQISDPRAEYLKTI